MGLSEKAKEYLIKKRKAFEEEQLLIKETKELMELNKNKREYVSVKEKEKENLAILNRW